MEWINIDGAQGEGGGQILRSALSLSMICHRPVRFTRIRAGRQKPGLMRQHLTAVLAAQQICKAQVDGAVLGSTELSFIPGPINSGNYAFDLGGAGSCTLVLQTLLPALWTCTTASHIRLKGGTHNPMAPTVDFLQYAWLPIMAKMGAVAKLQLHRYGFYPAGGGDIEVNTQPVTQWNELNLRHRGQPTGIKAEVLNANLPDGIGLRELAVVKQQMSWPDERLHEILLPRVQGSGNVLLLQMDFEHLSESVCALGAKGKKAEVVANEACKEALAYLASSAAVGEHLADQLLLPMALAGKGSFSTSKVTPHLRTNAEIIQKFLAVNIRIEPQDDRFVVEIERRKC